MFLAIDCGNSTVEFGFFESRKLVCTYKVKLAANKTSDEYILGLNIFLSEKMIARDSIDSILISSVVPSFNETLRDISLNVFGIEPSFLGPGFSSGVRVNTDNPKEVGSDLIADCAGAAAIFGAPCIICDLGTATKIILCGKEGSFEGCVIAPGIGISLSALVGKAALIGDIDIKTPAKYLGKNTSDSISSALTYGNAFAIRSLADKIEEEAGYPCKRILTGGFSKLVRDLLPEYEYASRLVLFGLNAMNERKK